MCASVFLWLSRRKAGYVPLLLFSCSHVFVADYNFLVQHRSSAFRQNACTEHPIWKDPEDQQQYECGHVGVQLSASVDWKQLSKL